MPPPSQGPRRSGALPWIVAGAILAMLVVIAGIAVVVVRLGSAGDDDPPPAVAAPATATATATAAPTAAAAAPATTPPPRQPELPEATSPVSSPAGAELPARPVTEEGTLRSGTTGTATEVTFVNTRRDAVTVYWLDFDGKRVRYQQVPGGQQYTQPTYSSHAWLVCGYDEAPLLIVVAAVQPGVVTIR